MPIEAMLIKMVFFFFFFFFPGLVQVKAAIASLKVIDDLPMPPDVAWTPAMDMLDWLGGFFGFQVFTPALFSVEFLCVCCGFSCLAYFLKFEVLINKHHACSLQGLTLQVIGTFLGYWWTIFLVLIRLLIQH